MPHEPNLCDAACQKIVINSGLVAIQADDLARTAGPKHPLFDAATLLASRAKAFYDTHRVLDAFGVITYDEPAGWHGCDRAAEIEAWSTAYEKKINPALGQMEIGLKLRDWAEEYRVATRALINGKA